MLLLMQLPPSAAVGILAGILALVLAGGAALALRAIAKAVARDQRD